MLCEVIVGMGVVGLRSGGSCDRTGDPVSVWLRLRSSGAVICLRGSSLARKFCGSIDASCLWSSSVAEVLTVRAEVLTVRADWRCLYVKVLSVLTADLWRMVNYMGSLRCIWSSKGI